jgi:hypothetical protein
VALGSRSTLWFGLAAAALAAGCSPTLGWREVRPEGSGALALFPCKPRHETRDVPLAGVRVAMTFHACSAGGATWALGFADVADPARVASALDEAAAASARNLGAAAPEGLPASVPGMTPHSHARRLAVDGAMPDGRAVHGEVAVFSKGTRVYQAMVVASGPQRDAVQTFFGALRLDA